MDTENDQELEDAFDLSETEEETSDDSTNSCSIFDGHQTFVLELHELKKDDPAAQNLAPVPKPKKHRKKKKEPGQSTGQISETESFSERSSAVPSSAEAKEEFYDAHDSYHAIPENETAVLTAARLQERAEQGPNPKAEASVLPSALPSVTTGASATEQPTAVAAKEPSIISKPVTRPE